jgi:leucyl-tRNA synthetase
MFGFNVLHPMGWDAFGLPAENAALKHDTHPAEWTYENIDYMKNQLQRMGFSYDWDRELATCDPEYYRWEQLFFIKMYDKGLIYRKMTSVNWCQSCQTVLANEQVVDGLCWRCDNQVLPQDMHGWFFRITDYADELLAECDNLTGWPEKVLTMQRNWIGKSVGAEIDFPVENTEHVLKIFTTRPDTIFGATFMSVAPEHPLVGLSKNTDQADKVADFVAKTKKARQQQKPEEEVEKEGVFIGQYCIIVSIPTMGTASRYLQQISFSWSMAQVLLWQSRHMIKEILNLPKNTACLSRLLFNLPTNNLLLQSFQQHMRNQAY